MTMERKGFIGGSDAKRILDGEWHKLWLEKTGRAEPEDLTHQFNVQLGIYTEQFHLDWLNKYESFDIVRVSEPHCHTAHHMIRASLDGWCITRETFVEVKHSNGFATEASALSWYLPQMAHYCMVMERSHGWLSVIRGNVEPMIIKVTPDKVYMHELLEHELRFWWHVEKDVEPEIIPMGALARTVDLAAKTLIDDMRSVRMDTSNQWADAAGRYLENEGAAKEFDTAKKDLKAMIEDDVREATGHGITIKRSKNGSLRITQVQEAAE